MTLGPPPLDESHRGCAISSRVNICGGSIAFWETDTCLFAQLCFIIENFPWMDYLCMSSRVIKFFSDFVQLYCLVGSFIAFVADLISHTWSLFGNPLSTLLRWRDTKTLFQYSIVIIAFVLISHTWSLFGNPLSTLLRWRDTKT